MKKKSNRKRSDAQLAQQKRFALAMSFLLPLKSILADGYKFVAKRKKKLIYPFNLALSHVLSMGIAEGEEGLYVDPEKVWLSDGTLPGVLVSAIVEETSRILVSYDSFSSFCAWDDHVKLIAYQMKEGVAIRSQNLALRSEKQAFLDVPNSLLGKELLLYILCSDRDGLKYARSQYLGTYQIN